MPSSVVDLLSGWGTLLGRGPVFGIWKQVLLCVLWGLWCERNSKFLRMWRFRLGLFVERCLICYFFGCWRITRVICCSLNFYFLVLFFFLFRDTFVYFMCTRIAPFCAF